MSTWGQGWLWELAFRGQGGRPKENTRRTHHGLLGAGQKGHRPGTAAQPTARLGLVTGCSPPVLQQTCCRELHAHARLSADCCQALHRRESGRGRLGAGDPAQHPLLARCHREAPAPAWLHPCCPVTCNRSHSTPSPFPHSALTPTSCRENSRSTFDKCAQLCCVLSILAGSSQDPAGPCGQRPPLAEEETGA